ncbi:HOPZ-ACTIVATED RESISTANCE 1 [Striga asiatica]|uniref:HOPZ-ACTIVATED RESISTANCE 1 n=1 Tax=Striga asiatica TaxID=4170 RepID=A0A5A7QAD8_STRAF|nr:HOPZ-ACTIVATED RESISTANCE 1 [Striga asiatica]
MHNETREWALWRVNERNADDEQRQAHVLRSSSSTAVCGRGHRTEWRTWTAAFRTDNRQVAVTSRLKLRGHVVVGDDKGCSERRRRTELSPEKKAAICGIQLVCVCVCLGDDVGMDRTSTGGRWRLREDGGGEWTAAATTCAVD